MLFHARTLVGITIGLVSIFAFVQTEYINGKCELREDPLLIGVGTKVRVKGVLDNNATEFSVNFVSDNCKNPETIAYHFKWEVNTKRIIQNYKNNGEWQDEIVEEYDTLKNSIFGVEFTFNAVNIINVYKLYENSPNFITSYEPTFDFSEIKAVQVWGDIEKVTEVSFMYP